MLDGLTSPPKTRFPWRLALKLCVETTTHTLCLWFFVGLSALLLEELFETYGMGSVLTLLGCIAFIVVVSRNSRDIWAAIIPALEGWLCARRTRLGL